MSIFKNQIKGGAEIRKRLASGELISAARFCRLADLAQRQFDRLQQAQVLAPITTHRKNGTIEFLLFDSAEVPSLIERVNHYLGRQ